MYDELTRSFNKVISDKSKDYCKDTFNNQVIGKILVDDRSIFMYPKGIYGSRFIEAKCRENYMKV